MNRHHPYGGPYDSPSRRGGSPSGPGPDRSRFLQENRGGPPRGRGGFGRGRGGYSGYDGGLGHNAYDQGPPQSDTTSYNNYDSGPQDPFYQSGGYGGGSLNQFGGSSGPTDGYSQGFGNFEDGAGSNFDEGGYGNRPPKRNFRRERDDKLHDSIIEERIQRERPCRTLFIRNIKYETNSDDVRRQFEEHGEIKTFFDLISTRGMVFVTYFDLRAAERARERLQGSEISGRPIDVHYSLPRDDHTSRGGTGDKNQQQLQGTLQVTLRNSASGQPIDDNEVRRKFQQFGDVKSVKPVGDRTDQRYVEFYDTRACDESYDRLRHQGLQDGVMDIVFAWDAASDGAPPGASQRREDRSFEGGREWEDRGGFRGRGGRGRGRGRGRGYDDGGGYDRRDDWDRDRGRGRYDDDRGGRGGRGRGGGYGGYGGDRYDSRGSGGYGNPSGPPGGYGNGPGNPIGGYGQPAVAPAAPPPVDERVEQARKVQQLLAALKQPQNGATPAAPPTSAPPPPSGGFPGVPSLPPSSANANGFYPPPLNRPPFPGSLPPQAPTTNPYNSIPPPTPQPGQGQPSLANLPPNILALLQQSQSQPQPQPQPQPQQPMPGYNMPPQQLITTPSAPLAGTQPNYNQLMAFLQSQAAANGQK